VLNRPLKIDVAVHGRFHAFHLARALHARGHDVRLLTNYPRRVIEGFGFPRSHAVTCVAHGVASKIYHRFRRYFLSFDMESALHQWFGRWVLSKVRRDADLIYIFSGVSEETLKFFRHVEGPQIWLARGSSHIRVQRKLMEGEEKRSGLLVEKPSAWMVSREEREYAMAQRIITLSSFAQQSFTSQSVPSQKVTLLLSAVDVARFRPDHKTILARMERISSGQPLRVLGVGTFSMRKGAYDLVQMANITATKMRFRFVGDVPHDALSLKKRAEKEIEFIPRIPEYELKRHYAWADIFVFPTIEDGFPAVLAQALAAGLPVLATPNSSAPDIVRHGETGWILPIRSPLMFVDQLDWCDRHRSELQIMAQRLCSEFAIRDWKDMACDVERIYAAEQDNTIQIPQ
jgi:glycosyltransferase involved in cell wall biosynthesis